MRLRSLLTVLAIAIAVGAAITARAALAEQAHPWQSAYVTAYASFENLTGCSSPGRCVMACGGYLNDRRYTVAANPRLGLGCGQRVVVCSSGRCRRATVTDRTASRFDMEFSYALAVATGMPKGAGWDSPRRVRWRHA